MKRIIFISAIMLIGFASACHSGELSAREKVLVRVILGQQLKTRLQLWQQQSPEIAKENLSSHPFAIALSDAEDKEQKLVNEFKELPECKKLSHAQALAYLGNNAGVEVLKDAAFPKTLMGTYMTSSGFEISESALCLMYLGFDFPDTFKFSKAPNALYPELDELLKE